MCKQSPLGWLSFRFWQVCRLGTLRRPSIWIWQALTGGEAEYDQMDYVLFWRGLNRCGSSSPGADLLHDSHST